jgi:hypothetical protein
MGGGYQWLNKTNDIHLQGSYVLSRGCPYCLGLFSDINCNISPVTDPFYSDTHFSVSNILFFYDGPSVFSLSSFYLLSPPSLFLTWTPLSSRCHRLTIRIGHGRGGYNHGQSLRRQRSSSGDDKAAHEMDTNTVA